MPGSRPTRGIFLLLIVSYTLSCGAAGRPAPANVCSLSVVAATRHPQLKRIWLHRRILYYSNGIATFQPCLLTQSGDIEMNPGPEVAPAPHPAPPPRSLLLSLQNARSLKPKLGDLRAVAAELSRYHLIAITETWLDDSVQDAELGAGLAEHTLFRRDRGSLGGGVACAVRSSLQPVRLPDPAGSELLLIRLGALSTTVAVCYRPPDDDAALVRLTAALDGLPGGDRLILVGDINLPELQWQREPGGAQPVLVRRSAQPAVSWTAAVYLASSSGCTSQREVLTRWTSSSPAD